MPSTSTNRRHDLLVAAGLVVVAALLRGPSLAPSGLFRDDAWQALATRADTGRELLLTGSVAPGFAVLVRAWSSVAGQSALALQMPAFLAGIILPAAVYVLGRAWDRSRSSALTSAALVLTAQWAVTYSARVKVFTMDALLVVGFLALGQWVADRPRDRMRWTLILVAAVSALLFSAGTAAVIAVALVVPAARAWRQGARLMAGAVIGTYGLVALGWYLAVLRPATTDELHDFWTANYAPLRDGPTSAATMARLWRAFFTEAAPLRASTILGAALACAVVVGALVLVRSRNWVTLGLLGGPLVLAAGAAAFTLAPLGGGRTDIYLLPCVALLAGAAFDATALPHALRARLPWVAGGAVAVLLIAASPSISGTYSEEDLRETVSWVEANLKPTDRVVVYPETSYHWAMYTTSEISLARDERAMTAFSPRSSDPRVLLLPGYEIASAAGRTLRYRAESAQAVVALAEARGVERLFVVTSTVFPGDGLPEIDAALTDAGFQRSPAFRNRQGLVEQWTRGS